MQNKRISMISLLIMCLFWGQVTDSQDYQTQFYPELKQREEIFHNK